VQDSERSGYSRVRVDERFGHYETAQDQNRDEDAQQQAAGFQTTANGIPGQRSDLRTRPVDDHQEQPAQQHEHAGDAQRDQQGTQHPQQRMEAQEEDAEAGGAQQPDDEVTGITQHRQTLRALATKTAGAPLACGTA